MRAINTEYVIFDVETTGLSPLKGDKIVEFAAIKVKNLEEIDSIEFFINPGREIPPEAQRINHITNEMVKDAQKADIVLPQIIEFIGGACVVGHNVKFDLDFLCYELAQIGRKLKDETPAIDTLKMSKKLFPLLKSYTLGNLAHYFGAKINETHRALADVRLTFTLLTQLLNQAAEQNMHNFTEIYKHFNTQKPKFPIAQGSQSFLF